MVISKAIKNNWIEIQKRNKIPVNAIGVKIKESDEKTLKIWKEEGIEQYLRK